MGSGCLLSCYWSQSLVELQIKISHVRWGSKFHDTFPGWGGGVKISTVIIKLVHWDWALQKLSTHCTTTCTILFTGSGGGGGGNGGGGDGGGGSGSGVKPSGSGLVITVTLCTLFGMRWLWWQVTWTGGCTAGWCGWSPAWPSCPSSLSWSQTSTSTWRRWSRVQVGWRGVTESQNQVKVRLRRALSVPLTFESPFYHSRKISTMYCRHGNCGGS